MSAHGIHVILTLSALLISAKPEALPSFTAHVGAIIEGDVIIAQHVTEGAPIDRFYTIRVANVSCFNIFSEQARRHFEPVLFDKDIVCTVRERHGDTLIADVEFEHNDRTRSLAQEIIRRGWSTHLREYESKALEIFEERAQDERRGMWQYDLDPVRLRIIQDSINTKKERTIDSLRQQFESGDSLEQFLM